MRNKFMENKKFGRIKKTFAVLLVLCFVLSATVASASATGNNKNKDGYGDGYRKGIDDGRKQGQKDCKQYGSRETLSKISIPRIEHSWPDYYKKSYDVGYRAGYIYSYNKIRYKCLKNKNKRL
jgi:hypothetical protein